MRKGMLVVFTLGLISMFGFASDTTFQLDRIASYRLPSAWKQRDMVRAAQYAMAEHRKSQSWYFGAGDPLEVVAWTIVAAEDASDAVLQAALDDAFKRVRTDKVFPEFGSMKEGTRESWVNEGNYQLHSLHDPEKVTFIRSLDRVKKVGFVARVYSRKVAHKELMKITRTFFTSLQLPEGRASYFSEVRDWPTVRATRVKRERAAINAQLAAAGLPPAKAEGTVVHQGWIYTMFDDEFVMGRYLGARTLKGMAYGARGELVWVYYRGNEWDAARASDAAKPKGETARFNEGYSGGALIRWGDELAPGLDRSKAHFFHVVRCPLTGEEWEQPRDVKACDLAAWMPQAKLVESAFAAGKLFIE